MRKEGGGGNRVPWSRWQMRGVGGGLGGKQEGEKARKYWGQSPIAPNTLPKSCRKLFFISYCGCRGKEGE